MSINLKTCREGPQNLNAYFLVVYKYMCSSKLLQVTCWPHRYTVHKIDLAVV